MEEDDSDIQDTESVQVEKIIAGLSSSDASPIKNATEPKLTSTDLRENRKYNSLHVRNFVSYLLMMFVYCHISNI
jgi:hypothetical protein